MKERTQDIETWREKLQRELNYLTTENEKLIKSRDELDHAIVQLKRPGVKVESVMAATFTSLSGHSLSQSEVS